MRDIVKSYVEKYPKGWYNKIRFDKELFTWFCQLPGDKPKEKLYLYDNDNIKGSCVICENTTSFDNNANKYKEFCSCSCRAKFFKSHKNAYLTDKITKGNIEKRKKTGKDTAKKAKNTKIQKYGLDYSYQFLNNDKQRMTILGEDRYTKITNPSYLQELHVDKEYSAKHIADIIGVDHYVVVRELKKLGIYKKFTRTSKVEKDISAWLKEEFPDLMIEENRKGLLSSNQKEIDIYIPEKNLGIEYCGLYWHSDLNSRSFITRNSHYDKFNLSSKIGIDLIHVFEDEWKYKQDIVKSIIRSKLKKTKIIYARKCEVKRVETKEAKSFLLDNHIQGSLTSLNYGLYENDTCVAVMSFGKSRYNRNYEYELLRYASKINTTVVGGASRLFNAFLREIEPASVISYSCNRYFKGGVYKNLGFCFDHESKPNYYYFTLPEMKRFHRSMFTKGKLVKDGFDNNSTETEIMRCRGYFRIWDCGNKVWIWKNEKN